MNAKTMTNTETVILEPDEDEAHHFPAGTIDHIELKILADNRHAATSLLRAFGGPLQGNVLADWVGDTDAIPAEEWEDAYAKVHFPPYRAQSVSLTRTG